MLVVTHTGKCISDEGLWKTQASVDYTSDYESNKQVYFRFQYHTFVLSGLLGVSMTLQVDSISIITINRTLKH